MAENAIAWEIWEWVHGQWRGGLFGGSLDYGAVEWISKVLGVEMNEDLLYKIRALEMIESGVENG